jgi:hypothetical protein
MDFQESKEAPTQNNGIRYLILSVFFALLSFFILLNFVSTGNQKKADNLKKSIENEFNEKDIRKELVLFNTTVKNQQKNGYEQSFRDVITRFMESTKNSVDSELSESPVNYTVKARMISFFGPGDNTPRSIITGYLLYLNKFIGTIRKTGQEHATIVLLYDPISNDSLKNAEEKIKNLHKILEADKDKAIWFSITPIEIKSALDESKLNFVFILFDKNEF